MILYSSDSSKYTLQAALQALVTEDLGTSGTAMVTPGVRMAGIVIAILPVMIVYPFMQRYFVQGITLCSAKEECRAQVEPHERSIPSRLRSARGRRTLPHR